VIYQQPAALFVQRAQYQLQEEEPDEAQVRCNDAVRTEAVQLRLLPLLDVTLHRAALSTQGKHIDLLVIR
jgi:hypothetical protein